MSLTYYHQKIKSAVKAYESFNDDLFVEILKELGIEAVEPLEKILRKIRIKEAKTREAATDTHSDETAVSVSTSDDAAIRDSLSNYVYFLIYSVTLKKESDDALADRGFRVLAEDLV